MISLNDGIYHPIYNANGWRRRYISGVAREWYEDVIGYNTQSYKDCFKESLINNIDRVSARPDGLLLDDQGSVDFQVISW